MNKYNRIAKMRRDNDEFYKRLGWKPGRKSSPHKIPDYKTHSDVKCSDEIPAGTGKVQSNRYTGTELLGIATMHKSNMVPVRKDAKASAVDISQMRRN